jgi:hypothetical protein
MDKKRGNSKEDRPLLNRAALSTSNQVPGQILILLVMAMVALLVFIILFILALTTHVFGTTRASTANPYQYSANCTPSCYKCGNPISATPTCIPVSAEPSCQVQCNNFSDPCSNCSTLCDPPTCHIDCKNLSNMCPMTMCPECETVCQDPTTLDCTTICDDVDTPPQCILLSPNCSILCQETVSHWHCIDPSPQELLPFTCDIFCNISACPGYG